MAENGESTKNGNGHLRIPWNAFLWIVGVIFMSGIAFNTWSERSYVDARVNALASQLTTIQVQLAVIQTKLETIEQQRGTSSGKEKQSNTR
jgi:hypothetical protein